MFFNTRFLPECSTFAQSKNLFWLFMLEWTKLSREFLRRLKNHVKIRFFDVFWLVFCQWKKSQTLKKLWMFWVFFVLKQFFSHRPKTAINFFPLKIPKLILSMLACADGDNDDDDTNRALIRRLWSFFLLLSCVRSKTSLSFFDEVANFRKEYNALVSILSFVPNSELGYFCNFAP